MSETPVPRRSERLGLIVMIAAVAGSFLGVVGWYLMSNTRGASIDASGFDLGAAPTSASPAASAVSRSNAAPSSLGFVKTDDEFKPAAAAPPSPNPSPAAVAAAPAPATPRKKGPKPFAAPKLKTTQGFVNLQGGSEPAPGGAAPNGQGVDVQQLMKNLPGGAANNPDMQKLLQQNQQPPASLPSR